MLQVIKVLYGTVLVLSVALRLAVVVDNIIQEVRRKDEQDPEQDRRTGFRDLL